MAQPLQAFRGDSALKTALLQRLAAQHLLKRLLPREMHWDGERGSVVGCLLEGTDLDAWERSLGLPKWLALAIDGLAAPVSRNEWRQIRHAATALTDRLEPGLQRAIAACAESSAWDPATSRSAVLDTLRGWTSARIEQARQDYPWKATDDVRMQARLDGLHAEATRTSEPGTFNVFELLEARHPEEADRLKAWIAFEHAQRAEAGLRALELSVRWLANASSR